MHNLKQCVFINELDFGPLEVGLIIFFGFVFGFLVKKTKALTNSKLNH